jgi:hypothetical protein
MNAHDIKLGDRDQDDKDDTKPRSIHSTQRTERKLVDWVTLNLPSTAETDAWKCVLIQVWKVSRPKTYWHKQIDSHVKSSDKPERATSQLTVFTLRLAYLKSIARSNGRALTDDRALRCKVNVRKGSKSQDSDDGEKRTGRFVDIGEDSWGISSFSEGGQSTRTGINTR